MSRKILPFALTALLLPGLAAADQVTVYRTKNADGTYTYSQVETRGSEARTLGHRDPDAPPPRQMSAEEQYCEQARQNLRALSSDQALGVDSDGDGVADARMSDADRASQRALAQNQVDVYCNTGAAPAAQDGGERGDSSES